MKITIRDARLLAVGFIVGLLVAVSFNTTTRPPTTPASSVMVTGPVLAAASLPPRLITLTNIQWQAPPVHIVLPPRFIDSFDSQGPLYPPVQRRLDLIDLRYQPDIELDDLK